MFNSENRVPLRALIILSAGLALLAACTHGRDWDTYDVRNASSSATVSARRRMR